MSGRACFQREAAIVWQPWLPRLCKQVLRCAAIFAGRLNMPVGHELIQQAAQGPQITSEGVLLVLPQLWRHVVRSANLGVGYPFPDHLGNAQITNLQCVFAARFDKCCIASPPQAAASATHREL